MDTDNGLGLGVLILFISIGLCMFTLFVYHVCDIKKYCKKEANQNDDDNNNNEYNKI